MLSKLFKKKDPKDELQVVDHVDVERYCGTWYEIASFPSGQQKNCSDVKAEYTLTDKGYVSLRNSCLRKGKEASITGKAFPVPGSNNAKLKVQIFWPFKAKLWVIGLADDYTHAVVSTPNRKYLWILSRKPHMDEMLYNELKELARQKGLDVSRLVKTKHTKAYDNDSVPSDTEQQPVMS
jgi:apolipoprotein D and lipocalin family protein